METWEKELLLTNALRAQKIDSFEKAITEDLSKGKAAPIGEIRIWNGKKYKKQANGKWLEVSEHGMTKKEHEYKGKHSGDSSYKHTLISDKLSDKEYDDTDFEEKEERQTYKKGDKIEFNGVTIHVGKDTSGGQDSLTYKAPDVSDKTYYDLDKLKEVINEKKKDFKREGTPGHYKY